MEDKEQPIKSEPVAATSLPTPPVPPSQQAASPAVPDETTSIVDEPPKEPVIKSFIKPKWRPSKKTAIIVGVVVLILGVVAWFLLSSNNSSVINTKDSSGNQVSYTQGASVTYVDGSVEYNSGTGWIETTQGLSLEETHQLRTGVDSRAIITLADGSAIRLNDNAKVTIVTLTTDKVSIKNDDGEVYTRVKSSDSRVFEVLVNDQPYVAMGTAYKTVNTYGEEGVEVYESKVDVKDKAEVNQGESYYVKTGDADKKDKVTKINLASLKGDKFLVWNKAQDEAVKEFADKLGVLVEIDKEAPKVESVVAANITASASSVSNGINVSWSSVGVDTTNGFKVTYSASNATPSYGVDSAKFVKTGLTSTILDITDGKTWYIRVCAYDGASTCASYSNAVKVTAPLVAPVSIETGPVNVTLTGDVLSWVLPSGTAPHGFKVVWNTSGLPEFPASGTNSGSMSVQAVDLDLTTAITSSGSYKVRVCKYNSSGTGNQQCVDYSDEVSYTVL